MCQVSAGGLQRGSVCDGGAGPAQEQWGLGPARWWQGSTGRWGAPWACAHTMQRARYACRWKGAHGPRPAPSVRQGPCVQCSAMGGAGGQGRRDVRHLRTKRSTAPPTTSMFAGYAGGGQLLLHLHHPWILPDPAVHLQLPGDHQVGLGRLGWVSQCMEHGAQCTCGPLPQGGGGSSGSSQDVAPAMPAILSHLCLSLLETPALRLSIPILPCSIGQLELVIERVLLKLADGGLGSCRLAWAQSACKNEKQVEGGWALWPFLPWPFLLARSLRSPITRACSHRQGRDHPGAAGGGAGGGAGPGGWG